MDTVLYWLTRAFVAFIQTLPLKWIARSGRAGGALAFWLDTRHRRVALKNLTMCFGNEKSPAEIRAIAKENFRRLGENYASAVKTASMNPEQLRPHFEFVGAEKISPYVTDAGPQSRIVANFDPPFCQADTVTNGRVQRTIVTQSKNRRRGGSGAFVAKKWQAQSVAAGMVVHQ